jgi:hypothetical protein
MPSEDHKTLGSIFRYHLGHQLLFELRDGQSRVVRVETEDPIFEDGTLVGTVPADSDAFSTSESVFALGDVMRVRAWPTGGLLFYRDETGGLRLVECFFSIYLRIDLAFRPRWSCKIGIRESVYTIKVFSGDPGEEPRHSEKWPREYNLPEERFLRLVQRANALRVPAKPGYAMGLDGNIQELIFENGHNRTSFRWRGEIPEEWAELEKFTRAVLHVARVYCIGEPGPFGTW